MSANSSASDVLKRMRDVATKPAAQAAPETPAANAAEAATGPTARPSGGRPPAPSPRPVRYTLDLAREQHRFLKRFALDAEADASEVMRALLRLLQQDPSLAAQVHNRLRQ